MEPGVSSRVYFVRCFRCKKLNWQKCGEVDFRRKGPCIFVCLFHAVNGRRTFLPSCLDVGGLANKWNKKRTVNKMYRMFCETFAGAANVNTACE